MQPFSTGESNLSNVNIKGGPNRKNEGRGRGASRSLREKWGEGSTPHLLHLGLSSVMNRDVGLPVPFRPTPFTRPPDLAATKKPPNMMQSLANEPSLG